MKFGVLALVAVTGATLGFTFRSSDSGGQGSSRPPVANGVVVAEGSEWRPSTTPSDWTTYAEHVVVVSVKSEAVGEVAESSRRRGEGIIPRTVALEVSRVLWSNPGAKPAPDTLNWATYGWQFSDGDLAKAAVMVGDDEPRLEPGHEYIAAIAWDPARCSPGDAAQPGLWRPLGGDGVLPFDGGQVGVGEVMGKLRSLDTAKARAKASVDSVAVEALAVGEGIGRVQSVLDSAQAEERVDFDGTTSTACP